MGDHHIKPGSPGDILEHHGVKGMRWGVRKEEDSGSSERSTSTPAAQTKARRNSTQKQKMSGQVKQPTTSKKRPIDEVVKTDSIPGAQKAKKSGLTRNQKMLLTFGALTAAGAGYYAYKHYAGSAPMLKFPDGHIFNETQQVKSLAGMKLPAKWDVSALKEHPLSTQRLGDLTGNGFGAGITLKDKANLVVNTSRGYADILPKDGFDNPFAAEQHGSVIRALEQMREKYPAIRNMNVEVLPRSVVDGLENHDSIMSVLSMRAGEARVIYNDTMAKPTAEIIKTNKDFLPGMGKKDYLAHHEMGHLLAVAHGEIPPAYDFLAGNVGPSLARTRAKAEPLLHKQMFLKHGFTFNELSKLSLYGATSPMEAMAELHGHLMTPEMRQRLTPDQITRATAMFNEMGGLS